MEKSVSICWLRRDLRLDDNAALYHALKENDNVILLFIFDTNILPIRYYCKGWQADRNMETLGG
jgi:deoxyribodipyrimidine photolyase